MSHVATVEIEIKDLAALEKACQKLGLEFVRDQKQFRYYAGRQDYCDHAIRVPGNQQAYEIGVRKTGKHYTLAHDDFGGAGGMVKLAGAGCQKIVQRYAAEASIAEARRQGYRVKEQLQTNGTIRLELVR
jgi:hypothetical protein